MKGFVSWLTAKMAILILGITLFVGFISFAWMQTGFFDMNAANQLALNIARTAEAVSGSPYNISEKIFFDNASMISFGKTSKGDYFVNVTINGQNAVKQVHCKVNIVNLANIDSIIIERDTPSDNPPDNPSLKAVVVK